jgi:hypothetical protein
MLIRPLRSADAESVDRLLHQLGYRRGYLVQTGRSMRILRNLGGG